MTSVYQESLDLHEKLQGKIEIKSKLKITSRKDLTLGYTPGVAEPCREIAKNKAFAYKYTAKGNMVAVITDGSAVLGLGNIGGIAGLPVMEGKAMLFKELAGIDAFPICLETQDVENTIKTIRNIAPVFGGINLEDIKAPECFVIEQSLQNLGIPVMHDDQHATAIVVLAALTNALKVVNKDKSVRIIINGAGAAGIGVTKLLIEAGFKNIVLCDSKGIIHSGRLNLDKSKEEIASKTNPEKISGTLANGVKGADIFIGLSVKDVLSIEMVHSMAKDPIIMAMANPDPEIKPELAKSAGAAVIATGRSDYPNQVNNVLAFPGVFKGALRVRATQITTKMKLAAALALANLVQEPTKDKIIAEVLDPRVVQAVSDAVANAWNP